VFKRILVLLLLMFALVSAGACAAGKPGESLKKDFPDLKFDSIKETVIKGLYEVVVEGNILYYYPEKSLIVAGHIYAKDKKDLTAERINELVAAKAKDIPTDKAVKHGNGKNVVVEFTDPDCPFCRKMSAYLKTRTDLTVYTFLFPLTQIHPKAEAKAKWVLCSKDPVKALDEVMEGKHDNDELKLCNDPKIDTLLQEHINLGGKLGIRGTPAFFINGTFINGADIKKFEAAIAGGTPK